MFLSSAIKYPHGNAALEYRLANALTKASEVTINISRNIKNNRYLLTVYAELEMVTKRTEYEHQLEC